MPRKHLFNKQYNISKLVLKIEILESTQNYNQIIPRNPASRLNYFSPNLGEMSV